MLSIWFCRSPKQQLTINKSLHQILRHLRPLFSFSYDVALLWESSLIMYILKATVLALLRWGDIKSEIGCLLLRLVMDIPPPPTSSYSNCEQPSQALWASFCCTRPISEFPCFPARLLPHAIGSMQFDE